MNFIAQFLAELLRDKINNSEVEGLSSITDCWKRPWCITLRWIGVLGFVALVFACTVPWLPYPVTYTIPGVAGALMVYIALAHYIRFDSLENPYRYGEVNGTAMEVLKLFAPGRFIISTWSDTMECLEGGSTSAVAVPVAERSEEEELTSIAATVQGLSQETNSPPQGGPVVELYSARFLKNLD